DHRLILKAGEIEGFAHALADAVGARGAGSAAAVKPAPAEAAKWVAAIGKDLQAHRGRSVVVAGDYQPASLHALAHAINQALGNVGETVSYGPPLEVSPTDQAASLVDLCHEIDAGQVELLVIMGGNPVFTAPADLKFAERLQKIAIVVYHGLYRDETSELCHW